MCFPGRSWRCFGERFKSGNDVEQFLVNAALTQLVESAVEILQQFVDIFFGALHRRQAAGVLTGQRLGACPEERDEEILVDERPQRWRRTADDLRQIPCRPGEGG